MSFSLDLSKFVKKAQGNADKVVRKVVLDLGASIVLKTPVGDPDTWADPGAAPPGYVGGRARGSWQYGQMTSPGVQGSTVDAKDDRSNVSIQRVAAGVQGGDPLTVHYITSTVPYMRRLEYEGWSKQAPEGMVRLTIEEYQKFVDDACRSLP